MKQIIGMLAAMAVGGAALAHSGATGVVKERMDAMVAMAEAMKVIVPMSRGQVAYDADAYAEAARRIASHSGQPLVEKFPEGSLMAPSEAAPAIWEDFDRFADLSTTLEERAEALAQAAVTADSPPGAEFAAMAQTCGACHEDFRIETD